MTTKKKIIIAIIIIILLISGYTAYVKMKKPKTTGTGTTVAPPAIIQVNPASVVTTPSTIVSEATPVVSSVAHVLEDGAPVFSTVPTPAPVVTAAPDPTPAVAAIVTPVDNSAQIADLQAQLSSANYALYLLQIYANRTPRPADADSKIAAQQVLISNLSSQIAALQA
jgi:hypothetical protein